MTRLLARLRVPLGFVCAIGALTLAQPSRTSWIAGASVALLGEMLRIWAAGHIEKAREITRSGPYRFTRHPLYMGSVLLGAGFALASASVVVALLAAAYLSVTLWAAIKTEEATLDAKFSGAYTEYRAGRAAAVDRPFSWNRVMANREYRAVAGLLAGFAFLAFRVA